MLDFDPILVHDWLSRSARRFPEKEALICGPQRWTYRQLEQRTCQLALHLCRMGLKRQDRVVVFLDNCSEAVISLYGILKAAGVFVIVNGSLKSEKLNYILKNAEPQILITHVSKARILQEALEDYHEILPIIWVGPKEHAPTSALPEGDCWDDIFNDSDSCRQHPPADAKNSLPPCLDIDMASLIYTSGSTGKPKGVIGTHQNIIAVARSIIQYLDNRQDDVILDVLPLSFGYGLYQVITAFMVGGTVVLEKSFMYLHQVLKCISKEKVTGIPVVPTIVAMLLNIEGLTNYDFSSLRYLTNAGAALPVESFRRLRSLFPKLTIFSMYGLTECVRGTYLPPDQLNQRPDSVGKAIPGCHAWIVDQNGDEVPPMTEGQLVIRGANVMQGYWKDPQLTEKTFRPGRYPSDRTLYTGDFFRRDEEGFLYFIGRKDDMIKCKGERINAKELENTLSAMEGIAEIAVIGVPDEILGQAVKVFVVAYPEMNVTEKEVLKYASQHLENFAVPKYVVVMDELPKTPNGKIDKKQLEFYDGDH